MKIANITWRHDGALDPDGVPGDYPSCQYLELALLLFMYLVGELGFCFGMQWGRGANHKNSRVTSLDRCMVRVTIADHMVSTAQKSTWAIWNLS